MSDLATKIAEANAKVVDIIRKGDIILEDIVPAREVIPFLRDHPRSYLHAGPPIDVDRMCEAMKGSVVGMILLEGWAKDKDEALKLLHSSEVKHAANNDHNSVGPMSGIITPSFPVYVVLNRTSGTRHFSRPADLHQQFGNFNNIDAVRQWRDKVAPALRAGLKALPPLAMTPLLNKALECGDELHNRVNALTDLLVAQLAIGMIKANVSAEAQHDALHFVHNDPNGVRLTLGLAMACAQALLVPATRVEYSTIVTCMARNGTDWGVRVSSLHPSWHTAPAPTCHKYYCIGSYTREHFGNDMGDSVITETAGWGAFLMANSMALAYNVGCTPEQAFAIMAENRTFTTAENHNIKVPASAFAPAPLGIDLRLVLKKKAVFLINTGIAHKEMGHSVVARGLLTPPYEAFLKAAQAYCAKYNVTEEQLLATLPQQS